jgi:hypothetical protein
VRRSRSVLTVSTREIALLKELDHPAIVQLLDVVHSDQKLFLVFEYLDKDLKKLMDDHNDMIKSRGGPTSSGLPGRKQGFLIQTKPRTFLTDKFSRIIKSLSHASY